MPERQPLPPRDYLEMGRLRYLSESIREDLAEGKNIVDRINRSLETSSSIGFSGEAEIICERKECKHNNGEISLKQSVKKGEELIVESARVFMAPSADEPDFEIDPDTNSPLFYFYVEMDPITDMECGFQYTGVIQSGGEMQKNDIRLIYD